MIKVSLYGVIRLQAGISHFESTASTLSELKEKIPNVSRKEADDLIVLVNGTAVKKKYKFKDGDEVVFMSPAGGG
ncbi:MAG: MoaD/ThiS family protein [Erysipelotrichales bacterium]|nr:MoaD/ThiS family protein [Erysipelotrichales bacterium]